MATVFLRAGRILTLPPKTLVCPCMRKQGMQHAEQVPGAPILRIRGRCQDARLRAVGKDAVGRGICFEEAEA
jgi:hypothetical protein